MQAPTILEPVGMTVDECRTAVTGGLYRTEDGTNIVIDTTRSNRISYSYVSHGSLSYFVMAITAWLWTGKSMMEL